MYRVNNRSSQCFIGDARNKEVHNTQNERSMCHLEDILLAGRAVGFTPDSLAQAKAEGFSPCQHCMSRQPAYAR